MEKYYIQLCNGEIYIGDRLEGREKIENDSNKRSGLVTLYFKEDKIKIPTYLIKRCFTLHTGEGSKLHE